MRTIDVIQGQSNRNQSLRLLMLLIIAGTFPFYCFAIYFIGSAPVEWRATPTPQITTPAPTFTPLGANLFASPAATGVPPALATFTPLSQPIRTPVQFVPPTAIPAQTIVAQTLESPTPLATDPPSTPTPRPTSALEDADFDGIADDQDTCPREYGYADNDGCPYQDDADRDGIRDAVDACPSDFAPNSPRGCRDFDDDGLDTSEDECPNEAGPPANRGCPLTGVAGG
ncbi:MAG: thrombospondin type 3 repeat-containing protein [Chloroflexi bacterium]|nr:thrombospondin type 3 repeat-containing protein [Chloroflexota bacterium]